MNWSNIVTVSDTVTCYRIFSASAGGKRCKEPVKSFARYSVGTATVWHRRDLATITAGGCGMKAFAQRFLSHEKSHLKKPAREPEPTGSHKFECNQRINVCPASKSMARRDELIIVQTTLNRISKICITPDAPVVKTNRVKTAFLESEADQGRCIHPVNTEPIKGA